MNTPIPGSARSEFAPALHEALNLLKVDFVEPNKLYARMGTPPSALHSAAFYEARLDFICVRPGQSAIGDTNTYLLHELIHWTGAAHRLARPFVIAAASYGYASTSAMHQEEAVAQLGMYILAQHFGLDMITAAAYRDIYVPRYFYANLNTAQIEAERAAKYIIDALAAAKNNVDSQAEAA